MRVCALQAALLALLLGGCLAPDRWNLGVSRGEGTLDGRKNDFDTEDTRLEVGVSGPLWSPKEARRPERPPEPRLAPSPPTSLPIESGGIEWLDLILILSGALSGIGGHVGYRKVKARKKT